MKTNVGSFDGVFRTLVFVVLVIYAVLAGTLTAWLWVIPGAILFATAILTWCPIYEIFGIHTAKDDSP